MYRSQFSLHLSWITNRIVFFLEVEIADNDFNTKIIRLLKSYDCVFLSIRDLADRRIRLRNKFRYLWKTETCSYLLIRIALNEKRHKIK